jgi:hypothetical protein
MPGLGLGLGIQYGGMLAPSISQQFQNRVLNDGGTIEAIPCLNAYIASLQSIGLYDRSSLILTANAYKVSKMYSLKPTSGAGDFTLTRASTAMRRNSSGIWESVANNVPRLNYPIGGSCPSWLFEPQRTNIVLESTNFAGAGWTDNAATRSVSSEVSPISGQVVTTITSTAAILSGILRLTTGATGSYSVQAFVKKKDLDFVAIIDIAGGAAAAWFNIGNGTLGTVNAGYSASIDAEYNGFYKITLTRTGGTQIPAFYQLMFTNTNGSATGAAGDTFLAYAGAEIGSSGTSPIVTGGATATRIADVPNLTSATALIGQTEGVLYWEGSCSLQTDLIGINQGTVNGVYITKGSGTLYRATIYANSVPIGFADVGIKTTRVKIALAYKSGDSALFVNGAKIGATNTTAFTFTGALSAVRLNDNFLIGIQPQLVGGVILNNTRPSDAECIALTTL